MTRTYIAMAAALVTIITVATADVVHGAESNYPNRDGLHVGIDVAVVHAYSHHRAESPRWYT